MSKVLPHVLGLAFGLAAFAAAAPRAAAQDVDPYDDALARAAALEAAGRFDEAASLLLAGLWYYPQDVGLVVQIAWLHRRAGRFDEAARYYRMALERSPGSVDARLGLAATLEAAGHCPEARPVYEALAADVPDLAVAREGAARCTPPPSVRATAEVTLVGSYFPDHPYKALAGGVAPGLGLAFANGFWFGGLYRYMHFSTPSGTPFSAWDQHEGYFALGWGVPKGGIGFHYAIVADGSGVLGTSHHAGMTARWSPYGDIEVRVAGSFYDDMKVLRVEPSWRIPIAGGLNIRPGAGLAYNGSELLPTGMATLAFDRPAFGLFVGGKYGDEVRPVYFDVPVVYATTERIPFGAWSGVRVNVDRDVRIHLTYAMDRLKRADGAASDAHTLAIGTSVGF